ncbi:MAG TPA: hypothetical protein VJT49_01515 [Amycolatopsis sp.]|uniref:hypothetical protein n=1 Tax=Amycolatopsis sp. TaxID=37632 RepID=UPI002B45B66D|nr:hypothetical protein [Amycolatopsis sp.]HKS43790.1 hypothetical protein [Amycolatopsis sp.]
MAKREAVTVSDETHARVAGRTARAGLSVHAWVVAAVEREAFRQLCEQANKWWAEHPEEADRLTEDFHRRQDERDSSAA